MDRYEQEFLREIRSKYPVLPEQEQLELLKQYKETGSKDILQKLVNHNLGICFSVAQMYKDSATNMTVMDLFQENTIILMNAIELYDPAQNIKFSSYVYNSMEKSLGQRISEKDKVIRIPDGMKSNIRKYKNFVHDYYSRNNKLPTEEEIKQNLGFSINLIKKIQETINSEVKSLDEHISGEEDSKKLYEYVPAETNDIEDLEEQASLSFYKRVCISLLTKKEYYIIYHRYIANHRKKLEDIGEEFNVTRERIRQIEKRALRKLKKINETTPENKKDIEDPLPISTIILLHKLKSTLTPEEYYILYNKIIFQKGLDQNTYKDEALRLSLAEQIEIESYLRDIVYQYEQKENYKRLLAEYHKKYTVAQILELDITTSVNEFIDYKLVQSYFENIEFEEIAKTSYYEELRKNERLLIEKYFQVNTGSITENIKEQIERTLTLNKYGYLKKERELYTIEKIKSIYIQCKLLLPLSQQKTLETLLFSPQEATKEQRNKRQYVINKLIRVYLRINNYFFNQITEQQIKSEFNNRHLPLTKEEKLLIYRFYGINRQPETIKDLAQEYNLSVEEMHDKIYNLKNSILLSYYDIQKVKKKTIGYKTQRLFGYYINNPQYEFSPETRRILQLYLDGKSYDEIKDITNLSKYKISNVITEGIRRCEFYQYRIILPMIVTEEEVENICNMHKYSEFERKIIIEKHLLGKDINCMAESLNINKRFISDLSRRFSLQYAALKCPEIEIEDYEREIRCHICDSILTEEERQIASLLNGIQSRYNETSKKFSKKEVAEKVSMTVDQITGKRENIKIKIRKRKLKLIQPSYGIINRKTMKAVLADPNLPISDKERDIICSVYELNGYPYLTEKELAEKYQEQKGSIKRRYDRAILSIKKYQRNLISKQISYETDIIPIEKYFGEYDRQLIRMYYKEKQTEEKIAEILGETIFKTRNSLMRIRLSVAEILRDEPTATMFDFDYARKVINNDDLPLYYTNKELVLRIYKMLTGEIDNKKYTAAEIINNLNLERDSSAVHILVYDVMLAVEKYKRGVRKNKTVSEQGIRDYYEKNKDSIPPKLRKLIEEEINPSANSFNKRVNQPEKLIYNVLKATSQPCVKLENITPENAVKILKNENYTINGLTRKAMKIYFNLPERAFMSGKEKMKALRLLSPLYGKIKTNKNKQKI